MNTFKKNTPGAGYLVTKYVRCFASLFMIGCFVFFTSCQNDNSSPNSGDKLEMDTSKIVNVQINDKMTNQYELSQLFIDKGDTLLVNYNRAINQIELASLNNTNFTHTIALPKEGPNAIRKIYNFHYYSHDSIFIVSDYHLHLVDSSGNFHFSKTINRDGSEIKGVDFDKFSIHTNRDRPIYFNDGKLYFVTQRSDVAQFSFPEYFTGSLIGVLTLSTMQIDRLPIEYPEELKENYFGILSDINVSFYPERIIYNFKHSPDIYIYNLSTGQIEVSKQSSSLQESLQPYNGPPGSPEDIIRHVNLSTEYQVVAYNENSGMYYRIALVPGTAVPGKSRDIGLTIFNDKLEVVKEMVFPSYHHFYGSLVVKDGLLIKYSKDQEENEIQFRLVTLQ